MGVRTNFQEKEEENLRKNAHRLLETKLKREMKGQVTKILGPKAQLESASAQQSAAAEAWPVCLTRVDPSPKALLGAKDFQISKGLSLFHNTKAVFRLYHPERRTRIKVTMLG